MSSVAQAASNPAKAIKVHPQRAEAAKAIFNAPVGSVAVWNQVGTERGSMVVVDRYTNKEDEECREFALSVYDQTVPNFNSFREKIEVHCRRGMMGGFALREDLRAENAEQKLVRARAVVPPPLDPGDTWELHPAKGTVHSVLAAHLTALTAKSPAEVSWENTKDRGVVGVLELPRSARGEQCRLLVQHSGPQGKEGVRYVYCLNSDGRWYAVDAETITYPRQEEAKVRERVHARYEVTPWQNISKGVVPEKTVAKAPTPDKPLLQETDAPPGQKAEVPRESTQKSPILSSAKGNQTIARFPGIKIAEQCATRPKGAPWGTREQAAGGPVRLEEYRVLVAHALRNLKVLYGKLTPEQESGLDRMWSPFFDHPTVAGRNWFATVVPLLDEYVSVLSEIEGLFPSFRESTADMLIASAAGSRTFYGAVAPTAIIQTERLNKAQARLNELNAQLSALGDAPNPLAAKCVARTRHKKAMGDDTIWGLLKQSDFVAAGDSEESVGDFYISRMENWPTSELSWNGTKFTYRSRTAHFDNACFLEKGQALSQNLTEAEGELSADGKEVLSFRGRMVDRTCSNLKTGEIKEKTDRFDSAKGGLMLYQGKPIEAGEKIRLVYTNKKDNLNLTPGESVRPGESLVQFTNYVENLNIKIDSSMLLAATPGSKSRTGKEEQRVVLSNRARGGAGQQGAAAGGRQPDQDDAAAIKEAVSQHEAIAEQYERNAARWAEDARKQTDPRIRAELEKRAAEIRANASAERDIAASLRTGTLVRTRTDWDDVQQAKFVEGIRGELAQMDLDNKRLENINKFLIAADGHLSAGMQERISAAIKSPGRSQELDKIETEVIGKVRADKAQEQAWREFDKSQADFELERPVQVMKQATSAAVMLTAMVVPGAGPVAVAYGIGTGFAEDGVSGAVKAGLRMYSPFLDVTMAAYEGGMKDGVTGAVKGAAVTLAMNTLMNKATPLIQRAVSKADSGAARMAGPEADKMSHVEAFRTTEWRYDKAMANAKTTAEKQTLRREYETIELRREIREKQRQAVEKADLIAQKAQGKDGNVNTAHEAYQRAKKQLDADMEAINKEYSMKENRDLIHEEAIEAAGLAGNDVKISGGKPKSALSDMDVTASSYQAGRKYVEALKARHGLSAVEYGDRWVLSNDTTLWKPPAAEKAGSSGFEAQVAHGASRGSDKFATPSAQQFTKGEAPAGDTRGSVIDNMKKAGEAGLGTNAGKDLHVIGKSVDKAIEVSGAKVSTALQAQLSQLRQHKLPEQAGVVTLGAAKAVKDRQMESFLRQSQTAMKEAYKTADRTSGDYERSLMNEKADAVKKGDMKTATAIQQKLAVVRSANRVALAQIADYAPGLVAETTGVGQSKVSTAPAARPVAWTPLVVQMKADREKEGSTAVQLGNAVTFGDLGERCKTAVKRVDERQKGAKPGSEEAKHFAELRAVLEKGATDPAFAIQQARLVTGHELAVVLSQLGVPPAKK
jgi:hypothetical protein